MPSSPGAARWALALMLLKLPGLFAFDAAAIEPALCAGKVSWPHGAADFNYHSKTTKFRRHANLLSPSQPDLPKQMPHVTVKTKSIPRQNSS